MKKYVEVEETSNKKTCIIEDDGCTKKGTLKKKKKIKK